MMKLEQLTEELIDINECSKVLNMSVGRLRKMCMKKEIPFLKLGGRVRFYKPDLLKWIKASRAA
jgi:excisionase family DNA binding protein